MKDKILKLLDIIEVDKTVFFGVLTKIWALAAAPITVLLIVTKFTPEYQGYYYAFNSLLALQVFVELGLGVVVLQFASHEWSKLRLDGNGFIEGDRDALSRLASLAKITTKWFLAGGGLFIFVLIFAGHVFFSRSQNSYVSWLFPWSLLCLLTGINVFFIPIWALLEGCNQVSSVYTFRFFQGIIASLVIWAALFLDARLWSIAFSLAATTIAASLFFFFKYRNFLKTLLSPCPSGARMDWRNEIFPMQWRIALSWISGYFVFSFFTPVIFYYQGPVVAGQFGMTWSAVGLVSMIAGSWLPPKLPRFGMLIAEKKYIELDSLFARTLRIFAIITMLSASAVWAGIYLLNVINHPFAGRLLPMGTASVFLLAQTIVVLSLPFSSYLRAHKKEPLLTLSLGGGFLTIAATFVLSRYSVEAVGLGYLGINILTIPFVFFIWHRCREAWHAE